MSRFGLFVLAFGLLAAACSPSGTDTVTTVEVVAANPSTTSTVSKVDDEAPNPNGFFRDLIWHQHQPSIPPMPAVP